jgi:putative transposase
MTRQTNPEFLNTVLQLFTEQGLPGFAEGIRLLVDEAMRLERSQVLQAQPYERTATRQGHANGFKGKTVATRLGAITFAVPQVRGGVEFYPSALEKGLRSEQALKLALAEMYIQGVSTRKVSAVLEKLCGLEISSTQVSQCAARLDAELTVWRNRPLGVFPYVVLDARYEKVRLEGRVLDCAVLIALGISPEGKRTILGVSAALSEAEIHWRAFLTTLQKRGLHGIQLLVSDAHAGLKQARTTVFPSIPWQRCQFHLQQNAQAFVTRLDQRASVAADIRGGLDSLDRASADPHLKELVQRYATTMPKLANWLEENLPEGLTVLNFPRAHHRRLRTSNGLERVNQELRRRTRVIRLFPNEASLVRLVSALLVETSEDWETENLYLNMENATQPSVLKC